MHWSAVLPVNGKPCRLLIEAETEEEATLIASKANSALEGPAIRPKIPEAQAYGCKEAQRLLGGVSRWTLYRWIALGRLERVDGTRKVLITRRSLERISAHQN